MEYFFLKTKNLGFGNGKKVLIEILKQEPRFDAYANLHLQMKYL